MFEDKLSKINPKLFTVIESQVGRDLEDPRIICSNLSWEKQHLDKMSQPPVQPDLKSIQRWGLHLIPREIIPMADCSIMENLK